MTAHRMRARAALLAFLIPLPLCAYTFTDALGRSVSVTRPRRVAVLQGSLAAVWQRAGGSVTCATSDAFTEPPAVSAEQAHTMNARWRTDCFFPHAAGVLSGAAENVGTMMNPNGELLLASGVDFVILSANIAAHQRLLPLLERAGIASAFFALETFDEYLRMLRICTEITGDTQAYRTNGTEVRARCQEIIAGARTKAAAGAPTVLLLRASTGGVRAKNSDNSMTGSVLRELGARNIADRDRSFGEDLSLEAVIAADPDIILVTTMGASEERALASFERQLTSHPVWQGLSAVRAGRCHVLPRELFHFKPDGERWADCYALLSVLLYQ